MTDERGVESAGCVVRLWSFGVARTALLSITPVVVGVAIAVGLQQGLDPVARWGSVCFGLVCGLLLLRVACVPFLWLEQTEVGGHVSCKYRNILYRRQGPATLRSVTVPYGSWASFQTDEFVIRSPLLSFERGPKSWGSIASRSEELTAFLCQWMSTDAPIDLRVLK